MGRRYDAETARHLNRLAGDPPADVAAGREDDEPASSASPGEPVAAAHSKPPAGDSSPSHTQQADFWLLLRADGVTDDPVPAGSLFGPDSKRLTLRSRLDALAETDPDTLAKTASELAYLANVLLAIDVPATGGSASEREAHARTMAFATASLGMELLEGASKDSSRWIGSMADLEQLARLVNSLRAKADERHARSRIDGSPFDSDSVPISLENPLGVVLNPSISRLAEQASWLYPNQLPW